MDPPLMPAQPADSRARIPIANRVFALAVLLWMWPIPISADVPSAQPIEAVSVPWAPSVPAGRWISSTEADADLGMLKRSALEDSGERARIIRERFPKVEASAGLSDHQRAAMQRAAIDAAAVFEAAQDHDASLYALNRAVALGQPDLDLYRALARASLLSGDSPGAIASYLAALGVLPDPEENPISFVELRSRLHRDLAKVYLLEGERRDAIIALDLSDGLSLADDATRSWMIRSRYHFDSSPGLTAPGSPVLWPKPAEPDVWTEAVARAEGAIADSPLAQLSEWQRFQDWLKAGNRNKLLAGAAAGMLAFVLVLFLIRQRGDLIVAIEYPDELRGVFRVRASGNAGRWRRRERYSREEIRKGGASTRAEHHLVNRETHFQRLLSRRFYVTVEGMLFDPSTDEVLEDIVEQKMVRVRHRRTVRLEFDVRPEACPVDVHVTWDDKPAIGASVVATDVPESLVRAPGHVARMMLPEGAHRLVVGCGDRAVEREVQVDSFRPTRVEIDLAGSEVVFKGCPPAVEPYLQGDIENVARALERDGQAVRGYLLLARMNRERGELERAADYFESAGQRLEAAELRAELREYVRAATLYLEDERPLEAAEMFIQADELVRAGGAYEVAQDFDRAIECYRDAGDTDKWINSLERRGKVFEAAKIALEHEQRPRAIRLLQCIPSEDADYAEACWQLAQAFERENHWDLASQKLEDHIGTFAVGRAPSDKVARLADLYESAGNIERAIGVLEELRRREPTFPNVASRIELLRKQQSAAQQMSMPSGHTPVGGAATEFVVESRYDLVEEIGRGGMGVVFEARDRRLDRVVALKRLPEDLRRHHPRALQLFLREAQSLAKLNHPNIVTVYDTDQEGGSFFITMELLHGEPFNRILKERGRLSSDNVIGIGRQVAAGLQYAHERGIVHRDIKTANLFLTTDRAVKIMDFGLAKVFEEVRGNTTVVSGTPFYMSPEQVLGGSVDHRTDLYSLGVTLFELATGKVPFGQGDIAYHHRHTEPPNPLDLVEDMDPQLADVILWLLAKSPDDRCATAERFLERLRSLSESS